MIVRFDHTTWIVDKFMTVLSEITADGIGRTMSLNKLTVAERKIVFNQIV